MFNSTEKTLMLHRGFGVTGIVLLLLFGPTGCANLNNLYLHDTQLNEAATAAATAFDNARPDELWQAMLDNVTASAQIEQRILAKSAEQRFEGKLTNLENLKWIDLRRCADGACWSDYQAAGALGKDKQGKEQFIPDTTQDKLAYIQEQIKLIGIKVNRLESDIRNPVSIEPTEPLEISSTLNNAIERVEEQVKATHEKLELLKNNALVNVQTQLDQLSAPLFSLFPINQRDMIRDKVDKALDSVLKTLDKTDGVLDLQTAIQDKIISEVETRLSDIDLDVGSDSGPSQELFDDVTARFNDKLVESLKLDQLLQPLSNIAFQVNAEITLAETAVHDLQTSLETALESNATPSQTARAINDLFNKTEYPALLKLASFEALLQDGLTDAIREKADQLSIGAAFDDIQDTDVSNEFVEALEKDTGKSICDKEPCQVKHVIAFLKKDESRIEVIRRSMLAEFRASELAIYNEELRLLKDELQITKELAATLQQQLAQQRVLAFGVERQITTQGISENLTVYHGLDCLARSAGATHSKKCAPDTKTARDHLTESLNILAAYFALNGHIKTLEQQQWVALVRHQHRASISISKLAARSREQLIANGLQGLVAFSEGGITSEQIAGVFRLANTSLLTIIAEGQ